MGRRFFIEVLIVLVVRLILCAASNGISLSQVKKNSSSNNIHCIETEKNALLKFRQGFNNSALLSSWVADEDCCKWRGVVCTGLTGHVVALRLRSQSPSETLHGELSTTLADLHHLRYLDLSLNDFRQTQFPEFLGSFTHLKYLNLSRVNFRGTISNHLANLSSLQYLDLSGNNFSLRVDNLEWLHGLSLLRVLDLGGVDLSSAGDDWLIAINRLPSLVNLSLFSCQLHKLPSSLSYVNFTLLESLDLSLNNFSTPVPHWFFNISQSLVYLNLSRSHVIGSIPQYFGTMASLAVLDLSQNSFTGPIPISFGNLTCLTVLDLSRNSLTGGFTGVPSLRELYLSENELNGPLEASLAHMSQLVNLDIAFNSFNDTITEAQLSKFIDLRVLDLSSNSLVFNVSSHWVPPFQLDTIGLGYCTLGPRFPEWIRTQKDFLYVNLSHASMAGTVPDWFWDLSMKVKRIDLSSNSLEGKLPDLSSKSSLSEIDLSNNLFQGPLVRFTANISSLTLANNKLSGPLSSLCDAMIPSNSLSFLDLSSNLFSGPLPDCWTYGDNLVVLHIANNSLSGTIPYSIGHLVHLKSLRLDRNDFSGEVPPPLRFCTNMFILDLGSNRLSGKIPSWIGEYMVNLQILSLRYNEFHGNIPLQLCQLKYVLVLDLGSNVLSGQIPRCMNNFLTMSLVEAVHSYTYDPFSSYKTDVLATLIKMDHMELTMEWMGREYLFERNTRFMKAIDLSNNALSGEIPRELTSLVGVISLNLSRNHLTGTIPLDIGALVNLVALDLSRNRLSCSIPATAADLPYLGYLNLSYNDLSGIIPPGEWFQRFEAESYYGNPKLCGEPLQKKCLEDADEDPQCSNQQSESNHNEDEKSDIYFMISIGIGFVTGFWGFLGTLVVKRSWRYAYFELIDNMIDKFYVLTAINIAKFQRKLQNQQIT